MSVPPKGKRDVIPRWRSYDDTALMGELDLPRCGSARPWTERQHGMRSREQDWQKERSLSFAGDLVSSAIVLGSSDESRAAAEQVLQAPRNPLLEAAARRLIEREGANEDGPRLVPNPLAMHDGVAPLRRSLRENARNAIRWTELSRFYTIAGRRKKAYRAMKVALALAPADRYVSRSAARLEIHYGRPDRAAMLLSGIALSSEDPWLLAAGLACASVADVPSKLMRTGQRILASQAHSPFEISELACAIGTLEAREGSDRMARRLFRLGLERPTDNSIAQAEWASRNVAGIAIPDQALNQPESWEARAWMAAEEKDHRKAVAEAWNWHYDQPFASRPAEFGSYHASIEEDYQAGAEIAKAALPSNGERFMLLNNLSFCLASSDRPADASRYLKRIKVAELSNRERATYLATRGLIAFRSGRVDEGRHLYDRSLGTLKDRDNQALASILLAREARLIKAPYAKDLEVRARSATERAGGAELEAWMRHLDRADTRSTRRSRSPRAD